MFIRRVNAMDRQIDNRMSETLRSSGPGSQASIIGEEGGRGFLSGKIGAISHRVSQEPAARLSVSQQQGRGYRGMCGSHWYFTCRLSVSRSGLTVAVMLEGGKVAIGIIVRIAVWTAF